MAGTRYSFGWTDPRGVFGIDALLPGIRFLQNENNCSAEVAMSLMELFCNETFTDERRTAILNQLERENAEVNKT
jgi:hypothetical protein